MALPPNWAKYTTEDGKEYFHNSVLNKTQWEKPEWNGQVPESLSFHSGTSDVYRPSMSELELHPRADGSESRTVGIAPLEPAGTAQGGKVPTSDEAVALREAPGGRIRPSEPGTSFGGFGQSLVSGMLSAASEEDGGDAHVSGMAGSALAYAQQLFDVSSDDVVKRLRMSLLPFYYARNGVGSDFRSRPDFWGPFWVATTAILFLAATGNFARLLVMEDRGICKADYGLVSLGATMIYGFLVGVPLLTRVALYVSGYDGDTINFRQMICVYGYSLAPIIPASVLCMIPVEIIRWLAVLAGLGTSLAFIRVHLWTDIMIEAPSLKWKMVALFCSAQAAIFLVYRVHFFRFSASG